eukprot:CAMPEP_0172522350 /NCGR_PEP_ID=MMETSP1066-20121228/293076_1 /TAXON_ID=671091 /ORGANISM="Coscinodiscus wailesii, Strain CCMP2513" /LENGTH=85 /DNA_ID=CAMNT_0013305341 /DNA_START=352 /DNA_END=608 /DNA_ORIENTATION=-
MRVLTAADREERGLEFVQGFDSIDRAEVEGPVADDVGDTGERGFEGGDESSTEGVVADERIFGHVAAVVVSVCAMSSVLERGDCV